MGWAYRLSWRPRVTLVIDCFFDDSGKESDSSNRFVVMAGYATEDWGEFSKRWRALLLKYGLPAIHMKEIIGIAEEREWTRQQLNDLLQEFVAVITASSMVGFGVGVDVEAFRALPKDIRQRCGNVQLFCCSRILRRVKDHLGHGRFDDQLISVIFDQDFAYARPRVRLVEEVRQRDRWLADRLTMVAFGNSEHFYPLQAADLLAWETRRQLVNEATGNPSTPRWAQLMAVLPSGDYGYAAGEHWTKEWFDHEIPKLRGKANE